MMDFVTFERRCVADAAVLDDRRLRWVSSPRIGRGLLTEYEVEWALAWPFVCRLLIGRFPWELDRA